MQDEQHIALLDSIHKQPVSNLTTVIAKNVNSNNVLVTTTFYIDSFQLLLIQKNEMETLQKNHTSAYIHNGTQLQNLHRVSITTHSKSGSYVLETTISNVNLNDEPEPQSIQPLVPICFPAGTPVTTDQGNIAIELLDTDNHTIRGNKIVAITQTKTLDSHIVSIQKDALGNNIPSATTNISNEHSVFYKGKMIKAKYLVRLCKNVNFIPYMGETLYNVLLDNNNTMTINNLICETLDTKNIMAKIINSDVSPSQKQAIYKQLSSNIKKDIQNQRNKQNMRKKMVYYV